MFIFKRSTGKFITVCQTTLEKVKNLLKTKNFGGENVWKNRLTNRPLQQEGFTSIHNFENDVIQITLPNWEF